LQLKIWQQKSLRDRFSVFLLLLFCDVAKVVIIQKKDLAKFGYMPNM
jgi:hypothetical protein